MAEAAAALAAARERVSGLADGLANKQTLAIFNETLGAADYARWRRELLQVASSAGDDFRMSLLTQAVVPPAAPYTEALVLSDTVAGVPAMTMPQVRQRGLLSLIKNSLQPEGESMRLIAACVHAGGHVTIAGVDHPQALISLDRRWYDGGLEKDAGEDAKLLYLAKWPVEMSINNYNSHFNTALTRASSIGQGPMDDSNASILLRSAWWHVIASPPFDSPYYPAAQVAMVVTRQECSTIAHRDAWRMAMLKAIKNILSAMPAGSTSSGLAKGAVAHARFGGITPAESIGIVPTWAAAIAPPSAPAAFGGSRSRRCPKCPLMPDGTPTIHPYVFQCTAVVLCECCNSDRHVIHSCFIANGVPKMAKLPAQLMVELTRLHTLYVKVPSQFNWRDTDTSLAWMKAMRERVKRDGAGAVVPVSLAGQQSRCWETASQGDFESQAEDQSIIHVAPVMLGSLSHVLGPGSLARTPALPQMAAAWRDPMGVSDMYTDTLAFDGRVAGSVADLHHGADFSSSPAPYGCSLLYITTTISTAAATATVATMTTATNNKLSPPGSHRICGGTRGA